MFGQGKGKDRKKNSKSNFDVVWTLGDLSFERKNIIWAFAVEMVVTQDGGDGGKF